MSDELVDVLDGMRKDIGQLPLEVKRLAITFLALRFDKEDSPWMDAVDTAVVLYEGIEREVEK
jgi:hypothetical protein